MLKKSFFAMIIAIVLTVNVLTPVTASSMPFTDLGNVGSWAYSAIEYVYSEGLMNGTGIGTTFSPEMSITRGMVVTVLYRNDGSPNTDYVNTFADVKKGEYYAIPAIWAYQNGIVEGTGENEHLHPLFSPDRNITRQELATMFSRYAAYNGINTTHNTVNIDSYIDSSQVAQWAVQPTRWAVTNGIITGAVLQGVVMLAPTKLATRAEFATIIQRYNAKYTSNYFYTRNINTELSYRTGVTYSSTDSSVYCSYQINSASFYPGKDKYAIDLNTGCSYRLSVTVTAKSALRFMRVPFSVENSNGKVVASGFLSGSAGTGSYKKDSQYSLGTWIELPFVADTYTIKLGKTK